MQFLTTSGERSLNQTIPHEQQTQRSETSSPILVQEVVLEQINGVVLLEAHDGLFRK